MKSFFEEYGFVILAAIIVILLIVMATPVGNLIKIQIDNTINSFGSKTQSKLNATDGIIQVRVSTANNKITLEWDAVKKEDKFKYQYKASNTKGEANWTNKADVTINDRNRTVTIENDSNNQPLANKTKVEYKIYDSNDQLVASGVVTAKVGKNIDGGSGGTGGDSGGETTENPSTPTVTLTAGQKIIIADNEYTVIEQVEGNKYKVLANELANSGLSKRFDASSSNYANSEIATYLDDEYYENLPKLIKNAIVETAIQRKISLTGYDNGKNSPTWKGEPKDAGTHNVFLPSWEELIKVAGDTTPTTLETFLNSKSVWLRDTCGGHVLIVNFRGFLGNQRPDSNYFVRPAFVINLSNVDYTKK